MSENPWVSETGVLNRMPAGVRIKRLHDRRLRQGFFAQVLFEDDPALVDDEGLHPRLSVRRREGNQGKARAQPTVLEIILGATGGVGALGGEDAEEVAVVGNPQVILIFL